MVIPIKCFVSETAPCLWKMGWSVMRKNERKGDKSSIIWEIKLMNDSKCALIIPSLPIIPFL